MKCRCCGGPWAPREDQVIYTYLCDECAEAGREKAVREQVRYMRITTLAPARPCRGPVVWQDLPPGVAWQRWGRQTRLLRKVSADKDHDVITVDGCRYAVAGTYSLAIPGEGARLYADTMDLA